MDPRTSDLPRAKLRVKPKFPLICPCGCDIPQMNAVGFCKHLVGFTVDRNTVELRELVGADEQNPHGRYERVGVEKRRISADDIIVEMETPTCRVYQANGDPLVNRKADSSELEQLREMLKMQSEQIRELQEAMTGGPPKLQPEPELAAV